MMDVIGQAAPALHIRVVRDSQPGIGLHAAIADGITACFADEADFVVASEEDVLVSDDVLEYMRWAAAEFRDNAAVLAVLAHSRGGQGWDPHEPAQDAAASQTAFSLQPYFNAWCWGTWRDRWEKILEPSWDRTCTSGDALTSGYDWNLAARVIPQGGYLCVVPEASRSQNIGRLEGWASSEWSFSFSQAQSFREHRPEWRARQW